MSALWEPFLGAKELKDRYGLTNFVETGTCEGDGLRYAHALGFDSYFSCDINLKHVEKQRAAFPHAFIMCSDSVNAVKTIAWSLTGPTMWWLDAHYPVMYGSDADRILPEHVIPVYQELEAASHKQDVHRDVFILDDIRIIEARDNPRFKPGELDDLGIPTLQGYALRDFRDLLPNHAARVVHEGTGALIFEPK
ncbi:MAG: hypothetical protein KGL39_31220 [Patescibacteria group bacterium]|nr:hypothetical protein [Patescibacteria group bacterium]